MMLLENFYKYEIKNHNNNEIVAEIKINNEHNIFKGHFPEQAIVPGVSQILIIKEILINVLGIDIQLVSSKTIKFLSVLNPNETNNLQALISYKIENGNYKVNAKLYKQEQNYLKFNGIYSEQK